jgi:hypothetical protein
VLSSCDCTVPMAVQGGQINIFINSLDNATCGGLR